MKISRLFSVSVLPSVLLLTGCSSTLNASYNGLSIQQTTPASINDNRYTNEAVFGNEVDTTEASSVVIPDDFNSFYDLNESTEMKAEVESETDSSEVETDEISIKFTD